MMNVFLMYPDRDFNPDAPLPVNENDLVRDLELNTLFNAMSDDDEFLLEMAHKTVLLSTDNTETILYRQDILKDCLKYPDVVKQIYQIPIEFMERKRNQWLWIFSRHASPSSTLSSALHVLEFSLDLFVTLGKIADKYVNRFESSGFVRFFKMIQSELDDQYLAEIERHIKMLKFPNGTLLKAQLGNGNESDNYILCKPNDNEQNLIKRLFAQKSPVYTFTLHPRDDRGARTLGEIRDRGLTRVANATARAAKHIEGFFNMLYTEMAFYIACLNLHERLVELKEPVVFPQPVPPSERRFSCNGLTDITLSLTMKQKAVGNHVSGDGKDMFIITGPNQGGKTTFLRSVGVAQLMMQCGMFVAAKSFSANICTAIFTHFKREEDKKMEKGKFEEELKRMSDIVEHIKHDSLVLFNESFAATNEHEGSEIARNIVNALIEKNVKVFYVTHFFELSNGFYENSMENFIFLRAERLPDLTRTFKIKEGKPLDTSYGADLYQKIFPEKTQVSF